MAPYSQLHQLSPSSPPATFIPFVLVRLTVLLTLLRASQSFSPPLISSSHLLQLVCLQSALTPGIQSSPLPVSIAPVAPCISRKCVSPTFKVWSLAFSAPPLLCSKNSSLTCPSFIIALLGFHSSPPLSSFSQLLFRLLAFLIGASARV